jgi:hypothetical protein
MSKDIAEILIILPAVAWLDVWVALGVAWLDNKLKLR